jgi:Zn-dependent protease/predicted transcriptional regulator
MRVGRIFGIEIRLDASLLVIAFLVGWSFHIQYGAAFPDLGPVPRLLLAGASVVVFFSSVLLHELSHSVVARRLGIPVESITLFLFGGVSTTKAEPSRPRDEFLMAVVGPLTSLALAGVAWLVVNVTGDLIAGPVRYAIGYLGWINLYLGLFNLLPGYPLDGGRVLRAILWQTSGSQTRGTRGAARSGRAIAMVMIAVGIFVVFRGNLSGLWLAAIGWFLLQAAIAADQDVTLRMVLKGARAGDVMTPELVSIPADASIREAVDEYFLRYDHSAFPVSDTEKPGLLTLRAVRQIPRDQWEMRQVWTAAVGLDDTTTVTRDTPMNEVLEQLRELDHERVLVVEGSEIVGIITPRDVSRWVRRSQELGLAGSGR